MINISQSALSQHLIAMKDMGILEDERDGRFVYYRVKDKRVMELFYFLEKICSS